MKLSDEELIKAVNEVVVVTMDSVPGKDIVDIVGLVEFSPMSKPIKESEVYLKKIAHELGANAVVGVKVFSGGANVIYPTYYGTAVVVQPTLSK